MVIVAQGCAAVNAIDDWDNPPRKEGETMHLGAGPVPTLVCGLFPTHALELTQQFSFSSDENPCVRKTAEHRPELTQQLSFSSDDFLFQKTAEHCPETDSFSKHSGVGKTPTSILEPPIHAEGKFFIIDFIFKHEWLHPLDSTPSSTTPSIPSWTHMRRSCRWT